MERCLALSDFKGVQFPDTAQPITLQKRYENRMPEDHLMLLTQLLVMDADKRLTAKAALCSPCFKDIGKDRPPPKPQQTGSGDAPPSGPRRKQSNAKSAADGFAKGMDTPSAAGFAKEMGMPTAAGFAKETDRPPKAPNRRSKDAGQDS